MHRFLGFPRPLASSCAPFLSDHGGSYMSVTKTVTQDQRKVRLGGARASTVACGWVSRRELCPWKGMGAGHALHMNYATVREVRHMTRQLPEVPDEAADEQPRWPVG